MERRRIYTVTSSSNSQHFECHLSAYTAFPQNFTLCFIAGKLSYRFHFGLWDMGGSLARILSCSGFA
jgi:hypothetical protein